MYAHVYMVKLLYIGYMNRYNFPHSCTVSGIGFGFISAIMQINPVLSDALGPATLPAPSCPGISYFMLSGVFRTS